MEVDITNSLSESEPIKIGRLQGSASRCKAVLGLLGDLKREVLNASHGE